MILSESITLPGGIRIKNRLFKSAMSEQLGDNNHNPTEKLVRLYRSWAAGGIGVSTTGNVMVDRSALGEPKNVVLDSRSDLDAFKRWAAAGRENSTQIWMQLNHPGKQSPKFLSSEPVAPSAVPLEGGLSRSFNTPRELTAPEIHAIIGKFGTSALLAKEAGFSGVQIHGAHGYLVSQFLSPHHNRRQDLWGGSLENRMRFVVEIFKTIRSAVGEEYPVGIKLNASDFRDGGFTLEDAIEVALTLEKLGIDLIEISGGSYENPKMMGSASGKDRAGKDKADKYRADEYKAGRDKAGRDREGFFIEYATAMKASLKVPLVLTGGFRSAPAMADALESGAADMIGLARPLAMDPQFANRLLADPGHSISLPRVSSGIHSLDAAIALGLTWYEYLLYIIGKGGTPDPGSSVWPAIWLTFWRMGAHGFSRRRAKKLAPAD